MQPAHGPAPVLSLSVQMLKSTRIRAKYDTNAEEALFILSKNPKTNKMSFNR